MTDVAVRRAPLWLCRIERGPRPTPPSLLSGAGRMAEGGAAGRSTVAPSSTRFWTHLTASPCATCAPPKERG